VLQIDGITLLRCFISGELANATSFYLTHIALMISQSSIAQCEVIPFAQPTVSLIMLVAQTEQSTAPFLMWGA
jgi:hypothetical protein